MNPGIAERGGKTVKSIGKDRSDDKFLYVSNLDLTIKYSIISTNDKFSLLSDTLEWY